MKVKNYIDLSVDIKTNMPCWPTNPLVRVDPIGLLARDGYAVEKYESVTHTGTHIDAPYHMVDGGRTVDKIPLNQIIGSGYCIMPHIDGTEIHKSALEKIWKPEYDGNIILVNTGWSKKRAYSIEFQYNFPGFSEDAVDFLIEHHPRIIGIDSLGIDPYSHTDFRVHKALLAKDMAFIEDLTNLEQLTPGKEYFIIALPLKIAGASGSMARVVALEIE